jgi:hypothetical protein
LAAARAGAGDEQRALALSDYLAKAHEEKLRAIQDVEKKRASEIQELKKEIQELKATQQRQGAGGAITMTSTSGASDDLMSLPKEALVNKVIQYQKFMEKYIVEAQEQKIKAVKSAEESLRRKFAEQLVLSPASPSSTLTAPVAGGEVALYQARNAAVTAAAAAGKSRWGDMEVQRAGGAVLAPPSVTSSPLLVQVANLPDLPEVRAADHGIRAEGSLSLAERVSMGVNAGAFAVAQASVAQSSGSPPLEGTLGARASLYQKRNDRVLAAAAAGKARWGSEEIERILSLSSVPPAPAKGSPAAVPVTPEVLAADHGLRSEGSVGGLTLAERVAQGANGGGTATVPTTASPPAVLTLYDRRNIRVLEAAEAGMSRWGSREVERVRDLSSALPPVTGSGGTALTADSAGRVNIGAQILLGKA